MTTAVSAGLVTAMVTAQFTVIVWLVTVVVRVSRESGGGVRNGGVGSGDGSTPPLSIYPPAPYSTPLAISPIGEVLNEAMGVDADWVNLSTLPPEVAAILRDFNDPAPRTSTTQFDFDTQYDPDPNPAIAWDSRYDGYTDPMAVPVTPTPRPTIAGLRPGQSPIPLADQ